MKQTSESNSSSNHRNGRGHLKMQPTCNACGTVDKKSRISQAEFVCTSCGNIDLADINASKIICSKGITASTKRKTLV